MPQQAQEPRHGWLEEVLLSLGPWLAWGPYFTSRLLLRLHNWWVRSRRKPLAKGYSRIEWECACGHHLFADFNNKSQDLLNKYTAILKRAPQGTSTNTTSQSPSDDLVSPPAAHTQRPNASGMSRQNTYIPGNLSQASTLTSAATTNDPHLAFLELCVNTGPHLKSLAEIDTKNISTDGMLFQNIKNQYLRLRGFRSRFWLLKPASISFVRFSLENRHRVGILQKPLALPPKSEVDAKKWIYDPCPLDGDPPIPENLFLHYLQCSEPSGMLFWMLRFPRKLETSLLNTMAPASFGWGIHIDEGPNFAALFKANFVVLLLSGLAAGLWCLFEHDFQGGFGFACWIIAVLNSLLMAYMFKWRQE
ncbi:hypothetical protein BKA64DRAFT_586821 [Cadophora sp. MPI-SDFR-AT-0126]|nr:hypothetical protein BKA64DRAFT_586821 [Leotiomycetes sp. MPI-SDFR-AT-0126]